MKHLVFDFAGVVFSWQPRALLQRVMPQHATDEASARHWVVQIWPERACVRLSAVALRRTAAACGRGAARVLPVRRPGGTHHIG